MESGISCSALLVLVLVGAAIAHADSERPAGYGLYGRGGRAGEVLGAVISADSDHEHRENADRYAEQGSGDDYKRGGEGHCFTRPGVRRRSRRAGRTDRAGL
jgi:hypothetical protein